MDLKAFLLSVLTLPVVNRVLKRHPYGSLRIRDAVSAAFHILYHSDANHTWMNTYWRGVPVWKCPLDLWIYQEIIYETKPDVIVEAGTKAGGSAYFFASLLELMQHGRVLTIDIEDQPEKPLHERITYLKGSSTSQETIQTVRSLIRDRERVMVSLDSDHTKAHVLAEMRAYADLVTVGNYLVVEDTNLNGHPVWPEFGPGPKEAVEEFLQENSHFVRDLGREKFCLTFNPGGYLKKVC
jgi:cephalosporin hydroxylase